MKQYNFKDKSLIFKDTVMEIFHSYRQLRPDQHEAGGIMLGRVYDKEVIIEKISVPTFDDNSGRYFFERNVKRAQQIIDCAWKKSGGELIYLGEWHTHPEPFPTPSPVDCKLIKNMLKDTIMDIDFLFLVIVGTRDLYVASQIKGKQLLQLI